MLFRKQRIDPDARRTGHAGCLAFGSGHDQQTVEDVRKVTGAG
jgi:hypothetical protein